jgi:hypothetical protein
VFNLNYTPTNLGGIKLKGNYILGYAGRGGKKEEKMVEYL